MRIMQSSFFFFSKTYIEIKSRLLYRQIYICDIVKEIDYSINFFFNQIYFRRNIDAGENNTIDHQTDITFYISMHTWWTTTEIRILRMTWYRDPQ